jgi:hypothetical protein
MAILACLAMPVMAQDTNNAKAHPGSEGCTFNGRFFTRGAVFCSEKGISIQCRIPPKEKTEELGSQLQWIKAVSPECDTVQPKTPQ